jgi:diguanylate cyclase (GGDEF)-like protein
MLEGGRGGQDQDLPARGLQERKIEGFASDAPFPSAHQGERSGRASADGGACHRSGTLLDLDPTVADRTSAMDRHALPGLAASLAAMVLATISATWSQPYLALAAAACALLAAAFVLVLVRRLRSVESQRSSAVVDPETGLPEADLEEVVEMRLAIARRHLWPVTIVRLALEPGPDGFLGRAETLGGLAALIRLTLRAADVAMRVGETRFVLLLDDTNEEGGVWTVERLQEAIDAETSHGVHLVAGIAAYPTHGLATKEILDAAEVALNRALAQASTGQGDPVEVAPVEQP